MGKTTKESESNLLPYLKSPDVVRAISKRFFARLYDLNKEMDMHLKAAKESAVTIIAEIERLEPRVGRVMTAAQFEEYVTLQRQLLETLRDMPNTRARIHREFAVMLRDCRQLYAPAKLNKFITAPFQDLKETKKSYPVIHFVLSYILLFIVLGATMFAFNPQTKWLTPIELAPKEL